MLDCCGVRLVGDMFLRESSSTPSSAGSAAKVACKSESEEVVLHVSTSTALPIVGILPCGAEVTVLAKQAGWYHVQTQDGKEGYVKETFLSVTLPVGQAAAKQPKDEYIYCYPRDAGIGLLESPEVPTTIVMMRCGEKIHVLDVGPTGHEAWDKIETSGGQVGYVWRSYVSDNPGTVVKKQLEAPKVVDDPELIQMRSVEYAIEATSRIRDVMLDATSFTGCFK